jgi:hypothetical protein
MTNLMPPCTAVLYGQCTSTDQSAQLSTVLPGHHRVTVATTASGTARRYGVSHKQRHRATFGSFFAVGLVLVLIQQPLTTPPSIGVGDV